MANIEILSKIILQWEGGYQCFPEDMGNKNSEGILVGTKYGVTPGTYEQTFGKIPTADDIKNLTIEQFQIVLKKYYWDRWKADEIENQSVANILVDFVWGSGSFGIVIPQGILKVVSDGVVGPKTIEALNSQNQAEFFQKVKDSRIEFVKNIVKRKPSQIKFLQGWLNRINSYVFSEE
jgi:lysozyme family protein